MKKRGRLPQYDHQRIKEMLLENVKPKHVILAIGCSYGVIRYVRNKTKARKNR